VTDNVMHAGPDIGGKGAVIPEGIQATALFTRPESVGWKYFVTGSDWWDMIDGADALAIDIRCDE
jgi:hypothetical protein